MNLVKMTLLFTLISCASKQEIMSTKIFKNDKTTTWSISEEILNPESAYFEPRTKLIFVSSINGAGTDKDGKGHISVLSQNGKLLHKHWIKGLNAPKGMRSYKSTLWVTDIDRVLAINIFTGATEHIYKFENAKFLNDIAIEQNTGDVYISDTIGSTIYKISNKKSSVFAQGKHLESPNGLLYHNDKLYVAAWGLTNDWSTQTPGRLYTIDLKTKEINYVTSKPLGNLDGLEVTKNGKFIVSDWVSGKVFSVSFEGEATQIYQGPKGTADIGLTRDNKQIILPLMNDHKVISIKL